MIIRRFNRVQLTLTRKFEFLRICGCIDSGIGLPGIADNGTIAGRGLLNGNITGFVATLRSVPVLGDANGDGVLNNRDIAAFVLALTNPVAYQAMFPDVDPDVVLDMNQDGGFDNLDVAGFVAALTGGGTK